MIFTKYCLQVYKKKPFYHHSHGSYSVYLYRSMCESDKEVDLLVSVLYIHINCTNYHTHVHVCVFSPSSIFLCHSLSPDASITLHRVYQVTSAVKYVVLNRCLEVPNIVKLQIDVNPAYPTEEKKREALIAYFLHSLPRASWAMLGGRLYYYNKHSSLEAAREYLQHTTG